MNPYASNLTTLQKKLEEINIFAKYEVFFGKNPFTSFFIESSDFPVTVIDPRGDPKVLNRVKIDSHRQYFEISKEGYTDACRYFGI